MSDLPKYVVDILKAGIKAMKPHWGETDADRLRFAQLMYIWSRNGGKLGAAPFRDAMWRVAKGDKDRYNDASRVVDKLFYERVSELKKKEKAAVKDNKNDLLSNNLHTGPKSYSVNSKDKLYRECLAKGVAAIASQSQRERSKRYMRARKSFYSSLNGGEKELTALNTAMFEAADWDVDEHELAMEAVNAVLKKNGLPTGSK
jgi:hypothetical protein